MARKKTRENYILQPPRVIWRVADFVEKYKYSIAIIGFFMGIIYYTITNNYTLPSLTQIFVFALFVGVWTITNGMWMRVYKEQNWWRK